MTIREIIFAVFIFAGVLVCFLTVLGIYRMPDFYTRCHASGVGDSFGLLLICIGSLVLTVPSVLSVKLVILLVLVYICNPIGSGTLASSAFKSGYPIGGKKNKKKNN